MLLIGLLFREATSLMSSLLGIRIGATVGVIILIICSIRLGIREVIAFAKLLEFYDSYNFCFIMFEVC